MKNAALILAAAVLLAGFALGIRFYITEEAFEETEEGVPVPILMYHNITDKTTGDKYTVTAAELESDLKYICENGYTAVGLNDLIAYTEGKGSFPKSPLF